MSDEQEWRELIRRIVVLKSDLMHAGMYKTGHALEEAVKVSGWELAEALQQGSGDG